MEELLKLEIKERDALIVGGIATIFVIIFLLCKLFTISFIVMIIFGLLYSLSDIKIPMRRYKEVTNPNVKYILTIKNRWELASEIIYTDRLPDKVGGQFYVWDDISVMNIESVKE